MVLDWITAAVLLGYFLYDNRMWCQIIYKNKALVLHYNVHQCFI